MDVRSIVVRQMQIVAREQDRRLRPLSDELSLLDCGLDSLCFAILVARLEDEIGVDPFSADPDFAFPATFGEFVKFYERAPL